MYTCTTISFPVRNSKFCSTIKVIIFDVLFLLVMLTVAFPISISVPAVVHKINISIPIV